MKKPGTWWTRFYLSVMFWVTGRAIQAAGRRDRELRTLFSQFPEDFSFCLSVWPAGPELHIIRDKDNILRYKRTPEDTPPALHMEITASAHAMALFTFAESTSLAAARGRLVTRGRLSDTCTMIQVLDRVETYLLPRFIAARAVKRHESPPYKHRVRAAVWLGVFTSRGAARP